LELQQTAQAVLVLHQELQVQLKIFGFRQLDHKMQVLVAEEEEEMQEDQPPVMVVNMEAAEVQVLLVLKV
jgi:hypothetical protein